MACKTTSAYKRALCQLFQSKYNIKRCSENDVNIYIINDMADDETKICLHQYVF